MFASDRDTKGVVSAYGISVVVHVAVLLLFLSYARNREMSSEKYSLTEITFLESIPDIEKPMQIEKPRNVFDFLKQAIPVKASVIQPANSIPAIKPLQTSADMLKKPALSMDKSAGKLTAKLNTIDLDNEIGKNKLSPALIKKNIETAGKSTELQTGTRAINLDNSKNTALPKTGSPIQLALASGQNTSKKMAREIIISKTPEPVKKEDNSGAVNIPQKQALLIQGNVSGRRILVSKKPLYPRWAQDSGITAAVTLFFTVTASGEVKSTAMIERTSGYPELDELAREALLAFRFEPLTSETDQTGYATFRYMLE